MDTHVANELISNSYRRASENAEINIDNIVAAVARLNIGILGLRKEIVAFKNENAISSVSKHNSSRYEKLRNIFYRQFFSSFFFE